MQTTSKFVLVSLILMAASVRAATVYTSTFEAGSQGSAFTTGALTGQGTPAWTEYYLSGYDGGGQVVAGESYGTGSQSLHLAGYGGGSSVLTLDNKTVAPWFEFAFKPNFDGTDNAAITWARTTRGGKGDVIGVDLLLSYGTGKISFQGTEIGSFTNGQWQTISFCQQVVEYPPASGTYIYNGAVDIYLGSEKKATLDTGADYSGLQTMVFSSAESSWVHNGNWYIDSINVGDSSLFVVVPEPASLALIGLGAAALLRRRRS